MRFGFFNVPLVNVRLHYDYLKLYKEECNSRPFFFYTPGITQCAVAAVFYRAIAFNVTCGAVAARFNGLCFCAYPAKGKGSDKEKFSHA